MMNARGAVANARMREYGQRSLLTMIPSNGANRRACTTRRPASAERVEVEVVREPGVLFDMAVVGDSASFDAILEKQSAVLRAYAEGAEDGDVVPSKDVLDAAEWIRQALVEKIENKGKLQPAQHVCVFSTVLDRRCARVRAKRSAFLGFNARCIQ